MLVAWLNMSSGGGEFNRDTNYITTRITADGRDGYPVEPGRYRLIVARACPWANRAIIVRRLLGLEDVSVHRLLRAHPRRAQLDVRPRPRRRRPGAQDPAAAGRLLRPRSRTTRRASRCPRSSTCRPVQVVTNDFAQMTLDLSDRMDGVSPRRRARSCTPSRCAPRSTRSPSASTPRSTTASTGAASPARRRPTTRPTTGCSPRWTGSPSGWQNQRYLVGDTITEADVRLFTTLARFDPVYHGHFKCNRSKLDEMPVLWALCARPVPDPGLRRHHRLRPDQAALLHRAHRHQPDPHRAEGPGPVELADTARPGSVGRQAVRRRLTAGTDAGRRAGARRARSRLGPDGAHRPLGVRPRELVARLVAHERRQLHREAEQPAAVRIHRRDRDRQRAARPELVDDVGALVGRAPAPRAHVAIAGGTDNCTALRASTANSPSLRGVSHSVGLSTSQN